MTAKRLHTCPHGHTLSYQRHAKDWTIECSYYKQCQKCILASADTCIIAKGNVFGHCQQCNWSICLNSSERIATEIEGEKPRAPRKPRPNTAATMLEDRTKTHNTFINTLDQRTSQIDEDPMERRKTQVQHI